VENITSKNRTIKNTIQTRRALSKEGSNLSGVGDDISELRSVMISMCQESKTETTSSYSGIGATMSSTSNPIHAEFISTLN